MPVCIVKLRQRRELPAGRRNELRFSAHVVGSLTLSSSPAEVNILNGIAPQVLWRFSLQWDPYLSVEFPNSSGSRSIQSRLPSGRCCFWVVGRNFMRGPPPEAQRLERPKVRCVRMMASSLGDNERGGSITPYSQQAPSKSGATFSVRLGSGCQCARQTVVLSHQRQS